MIKAMTLATLTLFLSNPTYAETDYTLKLAVRSALEGYYTCAAAATMGQANIAVQMGNHAAMRVIGQSKALRALGEATPEDEAAVSLVIDAAIACAERAAILGMPGA